MGETATAAPEGSMIQDGAFLRRLYATMRQNERQLVAFKEKRNEALRKFAGSHYGGNSETAADPINSIHAAASVMIPMLVMQNPRSWVRTDTIQSRAFAWMFETALDRLMDEIKFAKTERRLVGDSIFSPLGISKVGLGADKEVELEHGIFADVGQPFYDRVDLDDFFFDPRARAWEECYFMGNHYELPLQFVRESGLYDKDALDALKPSESRESSGEDATDNASEIGSMRPDTYDLMDFVRLSDVYFPHENVILTIPVEGIGVKPLREVEWVGPEGGPYDFLYYHELSDNIMPIPPVATWTDLHLLINVMARKLRRQAEREKVILAFEDQAAEDAEAIKEANDGETVRVKDVNRLKEIKFGGAGVESYTFIQWLIQMFSRNSGNTDLLGGNDAGAPTLGQTAILQGNANVRVQDMAGCVYNHAKSAIRKLGWYLFHDPLIQIPMVKRIPNTPIEIEVEFTPETMEGDYYDYTYDIVPYSMTVTDPDQHAQKVLTLLNTTILPLAQHAAMQGSTLNVDGITEIVAKALDVREVDQMYMPSGQMPGSDPFGTQMPPIAPQPQATRTGGNQITVHAGAGQPTPGQRGPAAAASAGRQGPQRLQGAGNTSGGAGA